MGEWRQSQSQCGKPGYFSRHHIIINVEPLSGFGLTQECSLIADPYLERSMIMRVARYRRGTMVLI